MRLWIQIAIGSSVKVPSILREQGKHKLGFSETVVDGVEPVQNSE